jgi:hypothetical protein
LLSLFDGMNLVVAASNKSSPFYTVSLSCISFGVTPVKDSRVSLVRYL